MAGELKIKDGSKIKLALDVPVGEQPNFNMICTFHKNLDESAFLVSIPMVNGKALVVDDSQKLLLQYGEGNDAMLVAGFVDDIVREGIRRYWKIRRVSEQRQFFQRRDERIKVALRLQYKQETWELNPDGQIDREDGMSLDISAGGAAVYMNRHMDVGEMVEVSFPRIGVSEKGRAIDDIVSVVCWGREAPKGSLYRHICGVQFKFGDDSEKKRLQDYIDNVKVRYKL